MPVKSIPGVAKPNRGRYASGVTANSVAGFGDPFSTRRTSAPTTTAGAFFVPVVCHGGCARETVRSAGLLVPRFANLRTAATLDCLATIRGSSKSVQGAPPMKLLLNPNRTPSSHAAAWKARAMAALRSDSSLSVRLRRYNEAMSKARAIAGGDV